MLLLLLLLLSLPEALHVLLEQQVQVCGGGGDRGVQALRVLSCREQQPSALCRALERRTLFGVAGPGLRRFRVAAAPPRRWPCSTCEA